MAVDEGRVEVEERSTVVHTVSTGAMNFALAKST